MTARSLLPALGASALLLLSACATGPALPSGMKAGQFTRMACEGGRGFAVRVAEDGASARVRALHGAVELARQGDGSYAGEEYKLALSPSATLWHKGKVEAEKCTVQAG
jgi:hypothetical protein